MLTFLFKRIWGGFGHETCITSIHQLAIFTGTRTKPRISWTSTRPPSAPGLLQPMLGKWYPQAGEIDGNRSFWLFSSLASPASQFPPRIWGVGSNPAENWFRAHIRWSYLCLKYGPLELHFFYSDWLDIFREAEANRITQTPGAIQPCNMPFQSPLLHGISAVIMISTPL